MADSLCGPSNALQNLQKHNSVDQTLQQDRLISRESPLQGFRSVPGPSSTYLDAEFEAFQNSLAPIDHEFSAQSILPCELNFPELQLSSWVSDFKKLNHSDDITPHSGYLLDLSQIQHDNQDWHDKFQGQQIRNNDLVHSPTEYARKVTGSLGNITTSTMGDNRQIVNHHQNFLLSPRQQQPLEDIFDQEAFLRAFDLATELERENTRETHENSEELDKEILSSKSTAGRLSPLKDDVHLLQPPIGADTIKSEDLSREVDQDSLSRTASKLLNCVHDERSEKFQNSQFLELMRQFREKKATIKGDQVVGEVFGAD